MTRLCRLLSLPVVFTNFLRYGRGTFVSHGRSLLSELFVLIKNSFNSNNFNLEPVQICAVKG